MGGFLERTIVSALTNLRSGDEYYIIDGGSTDNSLDIIKHYQDKISGWISEKDEGYADALAKGFNLTSGDILCWINSGDLLLPSAFDKVRNVFSSSNVDFIFGDDFYITEDDRVIFHSKGNISNLRNAMFFGDWTPLQDACFWRKKLYTKVGGINPSLKYAADFDLFLRFSVYGKTQYVPYTFSAFRKHQNQKSINSSSEYKNEKKICQKSIHKKFQVSRIKYTFLKAYYWIYVRLNARVLQKLNSNKKYNGLPITGIEK